MSIGLPTFEIDFIQKAVTAITRSERGIACIVVYDDTVTDMQPINMLRMSLRLVLPRQIIMLSRNAGLYP